MPQLYQPPQEPPEPPAEYSPSFGTESQYAIATHLYCNFWKQYEHPFEVCKQCPECNKCWKCGLTLKAHDP